MVYSLHYLGERRTPLKVLYAFISSYFFHQIFRWHFFLWWFMSNATFNNISVISWLSVSLVEETGVPEENHRPATSH